MRRVSASAFLIVLVVAAVSFAEGTLYVYFIDVGQGDAIPIDYDNWECLIDTGYQSAWQDDDPDGLSTVSTVTLMISDEPPIEAPANGT